MLREIAGRRGSAGDRSAAVSFVVLVGFLGRFRLGLARLLLEALGSSSSSTISLALPTERHHRQDERRDLGLLVAA